jgi:hypothetical protein
MQARVNRQVRNCVEPEVVMQYYRDHVIPLTKQSEVLYLINRQE